MASLPRIVFITCIIGEYDAILKEPVTQTYPNTAFLAFVGQISLLKCEENTVWTLAHADKHASPPGMINSFDNNQHTFNIAKYYKCQAYKCPELEDADIIVWLDGSIQITNPQCAEYIVEKMLAGSDMVAYNHEMRNCFFEESLASIDKRYKSEFWFNQPQPYQDVDAQAAAYLAEGCPTASGLWITCMLAYHIKKDNVQEFMDAWYHEILSKTTQDQIAFPYLVWKLKPNLYTLPDEKYTDGLAHFHTDMYVKHNHSHYS